MEIRDKVKLQSNTGYNLLAIGHLGGEGSRLYLINPHPLPEKLRIKADAIQNSTLAFNKAIYNLAKRVAKYSQNLNDLKKILPKLK